MPLRGDATLVVFGDDWGRHPSSLEHLVRPHIGHCRVVWFNTVGLRWPRLSQRDLRKLGRKLLVWSGLRSVDPGTPGPTPELHDLALLPIALGRVARRLNKRVLLRAVDGVLRSRRGGDVFILSHLPLTADIFGRVPGAACVYYLADDFARWPGLAGRLLASMDVQQAVRADLVVAAAPQLAQMHAGLTRRPIVYLPHGVDVEHFQTARTVRAQRSVDAATGTTVVFFGLFDERIDQGLLAKVVAARRRWRFLIVGPVTVAVAAELRAANVTWRGPVAYTLLPELLGECDVALLPYVQEPFGQRLAPLKVREALVAGLPVVATDIPDLRGRAGVRTGRSAEEVLAVLDAACSGAVAIPALAQFMSATWDERARQFDELLSSARESR
jgi:glycosyltransferase involved in cell wall biosynthesis